MSLRCLFGHDWTTVESPVETDRESVRERERRRRCTRCGEETVEKRTTQVSIAAAEESMTPTIATDGGSDEPEPPYDDEELADDEEKLVDGDDALLIGDDDDEDSPSSTDDRPSQSSAGADESTSVTEATSATSNTSSSVDNESEDSFNPNRFNGDVNETPDDSDAAILDAGPENTEPSSSSTQSTSSSTGTSLTCPFCPYEAAADDATIKAGDVCPECHQGFVEENE